MILVEMQYQNIFSETLNKNKIDIKTNTAKKAPASFNKIAFVTIFATCSGL